MIRKLPKIELHCHLDGSVRPSTMIDLAKKENIKLPTYDKENLKTYVQAPKDCKSLIEYLDCFEIPNKVMQTKEALKRITFELFEDASFENVKYLEVRFAPMLHTKENLSLQDIIYSVEEGILKAESMYDIKGNIILGCMRNSNKEDTLKVIEAGRKFLDSKVVAIDLCGPEEEGFCEKYRESISLAKEYGYRVTIHAGEAASGQNVIDAVNILGTERIGHGINIKDMKEAYDLMKDKNIILEMCPTSNIQTKAIDKMSNYPINDFYENNINVCINTDNRTVSNIELSDEIESLIDEKVITLERYKEMYLKSIDFAFASEDTKLWLKNQM